MLMSLVLGGACRGFFRDPRWFWRAVQGKRLRAWSRGRPSQPPPPPLCIHTGSLLRLAAGSGPKVLMGPSCPSPVGKMVGSPVQKPTLHRSISTKVLLAEGEDTPFTEHCRHYEDSYRVSGARELRAGKGSTPSHQSAVAKSSPGHLAPTVNTASQEPQALIGSPCTAPAGRDAEPEGPGTRVAPGPHQAPLAHQGRDHGRHPAQVAAGGRADCLGVRFPGGDESSLPGGSDSPPRHLAPPVTLYMGYPKTGRGEKQDLGLVQHEALVWQALELGS